MTLDWELHREVLKSLYLDNDRSLEEVRKYLAQHHNFNASKAQYEAQFKQWKWNKNWKKNDWKYVARKFEERHNAGKESVVFRNGTMIPRAKVKKEISRHVHPNDRFSRQATPPSPEYVTVCTPPGESMTSSPHIVTSMISVKRKSLNEISVMRQRSITSARIWITFDVINLDDLPFFQFQKLMRSQNVVESFEKIVTVDDPSAGNIVANYWRQSSPLQHSNDEIFESNSMIYRNTNDEFDSLTEYSFTQYNPLPVCKPFGIELLGPDHSSEDWGILEWSDAAQMKLPALLDNMPRMQQGDDFQQKIESFFGPPNVTSLRSVVEVGVYLSSNNIGFTDDFNKWMLQIVSWTVLKSILSSSGLTIRALAERFLQIAMRMENVQIVKDLLRNPGLKKLIRSSGKILITAIQCSNSELVRLLIRAGARVNLEWDERVPLVEAKTVEIARILVGAGANVNAFGKAGLFGSSFLVPLTALCVAARNNDVELARYLISAGADVNLGNYYGQPLEHAVRRKHRELVALLLKHNAQVSPVLQHATLSGKWDPVRLLLLAGADVNVPVHHRDEIAALQATSFRNPLERIVCLLKRETNVNASEKFDHRFIKTALAAAVEENDLELVKLLLNVGVDVNACSFSYYGCTALEIAQSRRASPEIISLLIAEAASYSSLAAGQYPHYEIELYEAVYKGDLGRVQFHISLGVPIGIRGSGYKSFDRNIDVPKRKIILYLDRIHWQDAVNVELFRFLLGKIEFVNAQIKASVLSFLLVDASQNYDTERAEIWINAGADVNRGDVRGDYPLLCAARDTLSTVGKFRRTRHEKLEFVRFLLRKGADVNAIAEGHTWTTALQATLYKGDIDMSYFLLTHGAKVNAPINLGGFSELVYAVRTGSIELVRELLDRGAEVNLTPSHEGCTALQAAVERANVTMVQLLLENGADVNAPGRRTVFKAVADREARTFFQTMLEVFSRKGAEFNMSSVETAFRTAADKESLVSVQLLSEKETDVNTPDQITALQEAALLDPPNMDMVQLLLENGADVNAPGRRTALQAAAERGDMAMIQLLVEKGADVNASGVETALQTAVKKANLALVQFLLKKGADINASGQTTAFQAAALLDPPNMDMVQLLLENRANIHAPGYQTALQGAIRGGNFQLAVLLLKNGIEVNAQSRKDPNDYLYTRDTPFLETALETAAYHGRLDFLHLLLKAGADMHLPVEERYVKAANWAREKSHIVIVEIS